MKELKMDEMMNLNGGLDAVRDVYWDKYPNAKDIDFDYDSDKKGVRIVVRDGDGREYRKYEKCVEVDNGICYI